MDERFYPFFLQQGDLGITKNYKGITLTVLAVKVFNPLLLIRIQPEIDKILQKMRTALKKNRFRFLQILTIRQIIEGVRVKCLEATLLFIDFFKAFHTEHRGRMNQIPRVYGLLTL